MGNKKGYINILKQELLCSLRKSATNTQEEALMYLSMTLFHQLQGNQTNAEQAYQKVKTLSAPPLSNRLPEVMLFTNEFVSFLQQAYPKGREQFYVYYFHAKLSDYVGNKRVLGEIFHECYKIANSLTDSRLGSIILMEQYIHAIECDNRTEMERIAQLMFQSNAFSLYKVKTVEAITSKHESFEYFRTDCRDTAEFLSRNGFKIAHRELDVMSGQYTVSFLDTEPLQEALNAYSRLYSDQTCQVAQ